MDIYSLNYEYFLNLVRDADVLFSININQAAMFVFSLSMLCAFFLLNSKLKKLEKMQINDIDDVTSYNRLIDDEIGLLRKEHDELNQVFNKTEPSAASDEGKLFNNAPYSQAVHLARRGYAREEIISLCSLTESEAELILALHANAKAA